MLMLITKVAVVMTNMITNIRIRVTITATATILATAQTELNKRQSSPSTLCLAQTSQI